MTTSIDSVDVQLLPSYVDVAFDSELYNAQPSRTMRVEASVNGSSMSVINDSINSSALPTAIDTFLGSLWAGATSTSTYSSVHISAPLETATGSLVFGFAGLALDIEAGLSNGESTLQITVSSLANLAAGTATSVLMTEAALATIAIAGTAATTPVWAPAVVGAVAAATLTMYANAAGAAMTHNASFNFGDALYNALQQAGISIVGNAVNLKDQTLNWLNNMNSGINNLYQHSYTNYLNAEKTPYQYSPILLDLNGDGIKTTDLVHGTYFDYNNTGFAAMTAWVDKNDGMLVRDLNGNGHIDNGNEVFGSNTTLSDSTTSPDGYVALATLDSNKDGVINSKDSAFSQLKILKGDGTLLTLQQAGIQSLSLTHTATNKTDVNGNVQTLLGSYTKTNGTVAQMADYNFVANTMLSTHKVNTNIPASIMALPDVQGAGTVYNLREAMAKDSSGQLKSLVQSFIQSQSLTQQNTLLDQILAKWANVPYSTSSQQTYYMYDTHKAVVEQFEGHSFRTSAGNTVYTYPAALMSQSYYDIKNLVYAQLMAQTQMSSYMSLINFANTTAKMSIIKLDPVISKLEQLAQTNRSLALYTTALFTRTLQGLNLVGKTNYSSFYNSLAGLGSDFKLAIDSADKQVITGTAGNDTLGNGLDNTYDTQARYMTGGAGNDFLTGGYNNDILIGGPGNDTLEGNAGNDTYIFGVGSGKDEIIEGQVLTRIEAGNDTLQFDNTVSQNNVVFTADSFNNLTVYLKNTADQIKIDSEFDAANVGYQVENFAFSDGTTLSVNQVKSKLEVLGTSGADGLSGSDFSEVIYGLAGDDGINALGGNDTVDGGDGNDVISGNDGNDSLMGGNGSDSLYGGAGNDTLIGGSGNDQLSGDEGNDLYLFSSGFGQDTITDSSGADTIQFGTNLISSNAIFTGDGNNNLIISFKGITDKVWVTSQLLSGSNQIETFKFSDGITYTASQVQKILQTLGTAQSDTAFGSDAGEKMYGFAGDDSFYANGGNDTLDGGDGNDYLEGDAGNDSLIGSTGDDSLNGGSGSDTLDGGSGNDQLIGGDGDDLYLLNTGFGQDMITESSGNDTVLFGSGLLATNAIFSGDSNNNLMVTFKGSSDQLTINNQLTSGSSLVETFKFADGTIYTASQVLSKLQTLGTSGSDFLVGSTYSEKLTGYAGDDYLIANAGNDTLDGGDGNDYLEGDAGNDSLIGGAGNDNLIGGLGNDTLMGGTGSDTYQFAVRDGQDVVQENDTTAGNQDQFQFDSAITNTQIAIFKNGNNLEIGYKGDTADKITILNQFTAAGQIEQFQIGTGQYMTNADVNLVIQHMNSYASSHGISITSLSTVQNNQNLMNIVAAGWHS